MPSSKHRSLCTNSSLLHTRSFRKFITSLVAGCSWLLADIAINGQKGASGMLAVHKPRPRSSALVRSMHQVLYWRAHTVGPTLCQPWDCSITALQLFIWPSLMQLIIQGASQCSSTLDPSLCSYTSKERILQILVLYENVLSLVKGCPQCSILH
jgi:hypothetical protein